MNLVTIVMPCYNSKLYLFEAVKSVLSQTYMFWELITAQSSYITLKIPNSNINRYFK